MGVLTKGNLVEKIHSTHPILTKSQAVQAMEVFLSLAKASLIQGEDLLFSGFGKFSVRDKKARRGRNPQTGAPLTLEARRVVSFKPSGVLREELNKELSESEQTVAAWSTFNQYCC